MTTDERPRPAGSDAALSKSARKREAAAAKRLGEALAELEPARRARIPLSAALSDAVEAYRRLTHREARRRQLQLIGRLIREEDRTAIAEALTQATELTPKQKLANRRLETWRERLLEDPDALTEYVDAHRGADVQALRHLIGRTRRARDPDTRANFARRLFRLLRVHEDARAQD